MTPLQIIKALQKELRELDIENDKAAIELLKLRMRGKG